ncbi:conserved hypothetical protein [Mycolicibacterium vanbaalenii PYR-1]|uniref:Uncharacterized protein n=1 Tax=Mycolicibacterium vanbaalenii (strain DSM 7251 / JCM 13017 / BCRC 16820 / KCTC 9966 / NRRL B-24157 / PYR-1) TaxID=350058 RepID=A1TG68_MYCVP|nr:conserved hypothetical protein [Mycolicibacterium vanbaalenii PYR-1]
MFSYRAHTADRPGGRSAGSRWPSVWGVSQLSFFSAESVPPTIADLTGILAAAGQVVLVGGARDQAARLSVVVDQVWRAEGLAEMIEDAGLAAEISRTDEDSPLVRTAVDTRLVAIATEWTRGAVKTVPPQWLPGPRELRAWTLAAGRPEDDRYLLGLDPHAPDTHSALASAMMRVGIAPTLIGTRGSRPALRISGRRRLLRLVENVGEPPDDAAALTQWPQI